jgi:hypothetical protein
MQTGSNPTVDANAAIPTDIQTDDPRHLNNLTKKMHSLNAQTSSDTLYDPPPPARLDANGNPIKESFTDSGAPIGLTDVKMTDEYLYAIGAAAAGVLVLIAVILLDPASRKNISSIEYSFSLLGGATVLAIMTLVVVYEAMQRNNYIRWYPNMRG